MRLTSMSLGLLIALASPSLGMAQHYSPSQVIDFFAREIQIGKTLGPCADTAQECARAQKPVSLDLLVTFELNSAKLTARATQNLTRIAAALKDERLRDRKFVIEGHTDASGTKAHNDKLADQRAAAVADFLVAQGISADRMTTLGLGESAPRVPDPYDPVNRRVELRLNLD